MINAKPAALEDIRVIELADEKCQLTGKILADLGADTTLIENPGGADARRIGPFVDDIPNPNRSLLFWYMNTSKRGVTLDLEKAEGRAIFRRLVETTDVLVESFPVGYLPSLGLGYDELSKINPRLIMNSVTGWGQTGPYKDWNVSSLVAMAMGGIMYSCGYDDWPGTPESQWTWYDGQDPPGTRTPPICGQGYQGYNCGAMMAAMATMAALYWRDFSGEGQYIDSSIVEAVNSTTEGAMPNYIFLDQFVHRMTVRHAAVQRSQPQHARGTDGVYIFTFGAPRSLASFIEMVEWMKSKGKGYEEDLENPEYRPWFARGAARPLEVTNHIVEVQERFISSMPSQEGYHGGQRLVMPWGIVRSPEECLQDPHLWDRGMFETVYHEEAGRAAVFPGRPYTFTETPWRVQRRAPLVGEHNAEVYCKGLGYTKQELAALAEAGII